MSEVKVTLNDPQAAFLEMPHKFRAFVAGFGSGKTWVGASAQCKMLWEHPCVKLGYFAPTYGDIRDIYYQTFEEVADAWGLTVSIKASAHEIDVFGGGTLRGTIICRSMDDPSAIKGFKIGRALIDELDTMPVAKAAIAWRKIIGRLRLKFDGQNGVDVTTTPEGFRFVYQQWVDAIKKNPSLADLYGIVHASTYDNEANLPEDYIDSLKASYPQQLFDAYINGRFVNLTSGSVYPDFDRRLNSTSASIQVGEVLHVGMDFNVSNMSAVLLVVRDGLPLAVGEIVEVRDTPEMARLLNERYRLRGHQVIVYPDASGQNTSSKNASVSDLSILRQAGFHVQVGGTNPAVKDRVNAVNAMILNSGGERRLLVNPDNCPKLVASLEQQAWAANGEPDKKSGHDHCNDALGYFIYQRYPIHSRAQRQKLIGF